MTPPLLAMESGGPSFSAALACGGECFFRAGDSDSPEYSRIALPLIRALLDDAGIALKDCGAFAFGAGPGRFSGLRMSCAFAQCFAHATGAGLVSVSSLAALAEMNFGDSADSALAALPAHRAHAYLAACRRDENGIWRAEDPRVICEDDLSDADTAAFSGVDNLCGEGWLLRPKLRDFFTGGKTGEFANPDARSVLRLAQKMHLRGETISPLKAAPVYVRKKIAFTRAERLAGKME